MDKLDFTPEEQKSSKERVEVIRPIVATYEPRLTQLMAAYMQSLVVAGMKAPSALPANAIPGVVARSLAGEMARVFHTGAAALAIARGANVSLQVDWDAIDSELHRAVGIIVKAVSASLQKQQHKDVDEQAEKN